MSFHIDAYLQELSALVGIESNTADIAGVTRLAQYLKERFDVLHWYTELIDLGPTAGPILKCTNTLAAEYDITFLGHMDTVHPKGTISSMPFRYDDCLAYGPGAADMKQGDLLMYYIARQLSIDSLSNMSVCMLFVPDEERSSYASAPYLQAHAKKTKTVFIMEPGGPDGGRCISRSGQYSAKIVFHGISAHAGYIFTMPNASALLEAANWTCRLMALRDPQREITVNVGQMSGGRANNIVPNYAELTFETRFKTPEDYDHIRSAISQMLASPFVNGVQAHLEDEKYIKPWVSNAGTLALSGKLAGLAKQLDLPFQPCHRGGLSNANTSADCDCAIIDAMGAVGEGLHSSQERLHISTAEDSFRLCMAYLTQLAKEKI